MNCYVFIGPTISEAEARQWLKAVYLPPVSQGDIASLLPQKPKIIGIIDGYFERVPSVWHKEILLALSQGVHVVGGASMGALRAAELYPFGMVGVGQVFEWYRDGKIEADDEVAVQHAPASYHYKPGNEALVNIRKTLETACEQGVISPATLATLSALGRQIYYPERSYQALLGRGAAAGLPDTELQQLTEFVTRQRIDQKKLDAVEVLKYIANLVQTAQPVTVSFELHYTGKLEHLLDKDICLATVDGIRLTADLLINSARLESDDFAGLRNRAALSKQLLQAAQRNNIVLTRYERRQAALYFRAAFDLHTRTAITNWLRRNHLSETEFEPFLETWALMHKLKGLPASGVTSVETAVPSPLISLVNLPQPNNRDLIRQLRWEGQYGVMAETAVAKEKIFMETPLLETVQPAQLYAYYVQQKQSHAAEAIAAGAVQLDFDDTQIFILELIKFYCYHQHRQSL